MEETNDLLDPVAGFNQNYGLEKNLPYSTAVLVLGICSIVGCIFYGLPGLVCGIIALVLHGKNKRIFNENPPAYERSYKNSRAGYVCSIIGISLSAIYFLTLLFFFIFAFSTIAGLGGFGR